MTDEIDPTLERAAEAVADQRDDAWPANADANVAAGAMGSTLERLRQLDRLSRAHRVSREAAIRELPPGMASTVSLMRERGGDDAAPEAPIAHGTETFAWGPLRVLARLGSGNFGDVYRAFDPALAREVALKLRRADGAATTRRWLDEARHLARVHHPNVVTVHGAAEHDGRAGLWTELLHGETLEARLERDGPVGAREAAAIGIELCGALAAVHRAGVVHGDVTTANVMREGGANAAGAAPGRVVLMDFGAGRERGQPAASGTPLACAPEVLEGAPMSAASDVYSLGALLFRVLTGRYPIEAKSMEELRRATTQGDRLRLRDLRPDLPANLVAAIEGALEPDVSRRFANAGAMEAALAASIGATSPAPATARRRLWPRLALAFAGLVAVIALGVWIRSRLDATLAAHATPPATQPAEPAPLAVDATLMRRSETGSEPVGDGGRVTLGDRLALEVHSTEPVWAYVFNRDAAGHAYALFPIAGLETTNPLSSEELHQLPGRLRGQPFAWQVTSATGDESFGIVASRRPLPEMESLAASLDAASPDRAPVETNEVTRGVGGMAPDPSPAAKSAAARLPEVVDALARSGDRGVWLRTVRVSNPPR